MVKTKEEMRMRVVVSVLGIIGVLCFVSGLLKNHWMAAVCGLGCLCVAVGARIDMRIIEIEKKMAEMKND